MWELDHKESWAPKNWCFWTVVLEKTLESPLNCKEIQPVHPKGNQSGIFIRRTDAEAESPLLWPLEVKGWFIGKDPDAGKDWRQEEKGTTEDEMFDSITDSTDINLSKVWETVEDRGAWCAPVHGVQRVRHNSDQTTTTKILLGSRLPQLPLKPLCGRDSPSMRGTRDELPSSPVLSQCPGKGHWKEKKRLVTSCAQCFVFLGRKTPSGGCQNHYQLLAYPFAHPPLTKCSIYLHTLCNIAAEGEFIKANCEGCFKKKFHLSILCSAQFPV